MPVSKIKMGEKHKRMEAKSEARREKGTASLEKKKKKKNNSGNNNNKREGIL